MNKKWNPNLAVAKMDPENDHFSSFWQCAWREKCIFTPFFLNLLSKGFTVTIFHIIFDSLLFIIHENEPKMGLKMSQKWLKNGYREQPYCLMEQRHVDLA